MQPVVIYYLEMLSPTLHNKRCDSKGLTVAECKRKRFQLNKFLYRYIGETWLWTDRLSWSDETWKNYVESENLRTWTAYYGGVIAGYYELFRQDNDVEIIYFGLAEFFIGKGFGGYLLSKAIASAWEWQGAERVWVHTCSQDHPAALRNYISSGMKIYKVE